MPLVEVDGETVSSTRIRALIAAGDMEGARHCLGAPFMVEGTVVEGDQRGRELGFPTANIVPDDRLAIPGHGVYAAFADGVPAAVNVGVRPTFETGRGVLIETYLIDREEDLYGKTLRVAFVARLRGEKRFAGAEELIAQMRLDVEEAKRVCASFHRLADDPTKEQKTELIGKYGRSDGDTGSAEVQVALLTERINDLDRSPARARQRPSLPPRPAEAGRQASPHAALPRAQRPRALPRPGRRARPAPVGAPVPTPRSVLSCGKENESSESRWPPTGRPEVGQLNEHV